jgi:hypothetical protein
VALLLLRSRSGNCYTLSAYRLFMTAGG